MARPLRPPEAPSQASWQMPSDTSLGEIARFCWRTAALQEKRRFAFALLLLFALSILVGAVLVFESVQRGEFISALAARDFARFRGASVLLAGILILSALLLSFSAYVRDRLGLSWRKGFSRQVMKAYLADRHYYHLPTEVDNPDQRISEDIKNVSQLSFTVLSIFLESGVQLIGFIGVLLSISLGLTGFLLVYALLGSVIAILIFGRRLTRINAEQLKREADFRFNLIDVRENAESIAFYHAQSADHTQSIDSSSHIDTASSAGSLPNNLESRTAHDQFNRVVWNFNRFIRWQLGLDCFQNGYQYLTFILPSLILAPRILAGDLEVGAIVQSQAAFDRIWLSLSLIVVQFEQLTALAASTARLHSLLSAIQRQRSKYMSTIDIVEQPQIAVSNLSLYLPADLGPTDSGEKLPEKLAGKQQTLFEDLSFSVDASLLIVGPSGIGKSSLVKAIAALWKTGQGTIARPDSVLFLPQKPYLTLGTLREQLLYPKALEKALEDSEISDERLQSVLSQVQLSHLSDLGSSLDWANQLSTGEQQRLAIARLLLQNPSYAILDEATSALSLQQEEHLYQQLAKTNICFISIGHRPSLTAYHQQILTLKDAHTWTLQSAHD
ncbi:ABC transporter ATP-binding protein/permease [cf. Phormidesmis sp. LEGE 11477]|uniref:ABC transporter ATP-binding protein/permease n=1 Tax=cf. Phormidesmis sp. LEGE 11477 TaxID=1828680 RepID=UPI001880B5F8|nr:ATP-binding cassette domain-containing protein [cf. Phormidesmis sp. LEGE 11477]MBE9064281.1 ABC transporter ATP-binding protein/permease [cf. Phormidesmis sp. LEGE 11477]